jgi:hypothetical protein
VEFKIAEIIGFFSIFSKSLAGYGFLYYNEGWSMFSHYRYEIQKGCYGKGKYHEF